MSTKRRTVANTIATQPASRRIEPCVRRDCGGNITWPHPHPTTPYTVHCDGEFPHTFDVTPL